MKRKFLQGAFGCALALLSFAPVSASETLVLVNGTKLVGDIVSDANGRIVFKDAVLGTLTLDASAVVSRKSSDVAATAAAVSAAAPAAAEPAVAATGHPPADPNKVVWTRGLQLNYTYISGAAPTLGIGSSVNFGASLMLERATSENIASFTGSYNRGHSRPAPPSVDNMTLSFQYDHIYTEKVRFISHATYLTDKPKKIDHRFEELAGVGYTFVKSPKAFLLVAPCLGFSMGQKEFVGSEEEHFGYGAYQTLNYNFTPKFSLEQRIFYFGAFAEGSYYVYSGYLGLKSQVTSTIAMTAGLNVVHDNQMAPGIANTSYQVMSGLQLKF